MPTGYSGKPLYQKLGIKAGQRICVLGAPVDYHTLLEGDVPHLTIGHDPHAKVDIVHLFETRTGELRKQLPLLIKAIAPDGAIWVSWPKKAARMDTDITEDIIRQVAIPLGLVDVKVCAVNDTWSGLKLVIRLERR
ncbi:MAG TPA: DUF3052 family protein [Longimicrobiales bacterium]|nr:DUF3052 family protein [Longimicrobiales bacterium]